MTVELSERHPVDRLAEEFVARYRRGERPSISEYTRKYPQLADKLQGILAALVLMEEHAPARAPLGDSSSQERRAEVPAPQQLGEYSIIRELGRGGMGVVYEAVQQSLGRHVALKVLPSYSLIDPLRLKRFQHEAQAAARLHHTNIVPVFGVGMEAGVHFYAMQFIQGRSLDEVLGELRRLKQPNASVTDRLQVNGRSGDRDAEPALAQSNGQSLSVTNLSTLSDSPRYYRSVATLASQVAEALEYAHRQGVVHRDVKPANLLLDAEGTIWITDFGLARCTGQEELTQTGDLVGTLRYAAPERLRRDGDARSDVYSLGVTLYELLTLRHPFNAVDRLTLVRQIAQDEPPAPRRLDWRIPRDLETIVVKAMASDPARRYPTAGDMAADLRRFLDDRPIAARRTGIGERLWRWCLRRPALASLAAALTLSLAIGIVGICWQWARAEHNLIEATRHQGNAETMLAKAQSEQRRAEQNLEEAARQRTIARREANQAETNYQTARKSVDELLTMVSEEELMNQPGLQPLRLTLLTRALEFYQQMLAKREEDPSARRAVALAYFRLGQLKKQMGKKNEALDAYQRVIEILKAAEADGTGDREAAVLLVRTYIIVAVVQFDNRQRSAGRETLKLAQDIVDRLVSAAPEDSAVQWAAATTLNNLAYFISDSKELDFHSRKEESLILHSQVLAAFRRRGERRPEDLNVQMNIAWVLSNISRRHASLKQYDEARRCIDECLEIRLKVGQCRPQSLEIQTYIASAYNARADIVLWSGSKDCALVAAAAADYERALEIQEKLARQNPAIATYWAELTGTLENLSQLYSQAGDTQRALAWRRREIEALEARLHHDSQNAEVRAHRAKQINGQATFEEKLGLYAESLNSRQRSRESWRVIQKQPQQLAANRANIVLNLTDLMIELGNQHRASELCAVASERRELAGDKPVDLLLLSYDLERAFRAVRRGLPLDEQQTAKTAEYQQLAVKLFREAAQRAPRDAQRFSRDFENMKPYFRLIELDAKIALDPNDAAALISRARWLQQLDDRPACQQDRDQALALLNAQLESNPNDASLLKYRGWLQLDEERWDNAVADFTAGLAHQSNDLLLLRLRAKANMRLGQWQRAYDDFTTILQLAPNQLFHWPERCRAALELGLESEAVADANALSELAEKYPATADSLVTEFMLRHDIARFPDATLALALQATQRHPNDNVFRGELGGVQFYLGRYRDAVENLEPNAADGPSASSASAGFWLAMSLHHLGELNKAQAAFRRAVRNWKGMPALPAEEEKLLRLLWQEAKALLDGSEVTAAAAGE